jgi:hypothetical protein
MKKMIENEELYSLTKREMAIELTWALVEVNKQIDIITDGHQVEKMFYYSLKKDRYLLYKPYFQSIYDPVIQFKYLLKMAGIEYENYSDVSEP